MSNGQQAAEYVRLREKIAAAICNRAFREELWDMPLVEIDIETMAEEILDALALIDGPKPTVFDKETHE